MISSLPWPRALALAFLGMLLALPEAPRAGRAAEPPRPLSAEGVRALLARFQAERAAADKEGRVRQFSPDWYQRADGLARQAQEALDADRLNPAHEILRR